MTYLAAPIVIALYLGWKVWTRDWRMWIPVHEIDLKSNLRMHIPDGDEEEKMEERTWANLPKRVFHSLF